MSEVTRILAAIEGGDPHAADQLLPLVYGELRKLAANRLAREKPEQTLQATALVHEAYLRLVDVEKAQSWSSRGHFFAAAAEAMRRILVDHARKKRSLKHGGGRIHYPLNEAKLLVPEAGADVLAVNEALDCLAATDPEAAALVKLRFFAGLSTREAAEAVGLSTRTAEGTGQGLFGRIIAAGVGDGADRSADSVAGSCLAPVVLVAGLAVGMVLIAGGQAINDAGQVAFEANLPNGNEAIYRREHDGSRQGVCHRVP